MDRWKFRPPPTERQVATSKSLAIVLGAFGIIALTMGILLLMLGGSDSPSILNLGLFLCLGSLFVYVAVVNRRRKFLRSCTSAEAKVVDRNQRKIRAGIGDNLSSDSGCALVALLMILLLVVELFLLALEGIGLRERRYRYVDHKLILEFQAAKPSNGKTSVTTELAVNESMYESYPPGSVVSIRYAKDHPEIVEIVENANSNK